MGRIMTAMVRISGVLLTPLREIADARGAVLHMLRADDAAFTAFGECYFSEIVPGAVKAWKRHLRQTQNLAVPVGRVRFVIYDARATSPTCGCIEAIELGRPDAYARLTIPPFVWYGFRGIGTQPALVANCADLPHDPEESEAVAIDALDSKEPLARLQGMGSGS
jgi:dTDP-4-dehydrorhamnose 3,5-epimerase